MHLLSQLVQFFLIRVSRPEGYQILQVRRFKPGFEALGLVADFIAATPPFGAFGASKLLMALRRQLSAGCHLAGFEGDQLVAYCGWMPISVQIGIDWMRGEGELTPFENEHSDAGAVTIVRIVNRQDVIPMIRACRLANPNMRVFFKRDYAVGVMGTKKATVMNRISR